MTLADEMARAIAREINRRCLAAIGIADDYCENHHAPLNQSQRFALHTLPVYAFDGLQDWLEQHLAGLRLDTDAPIEPGRVFEEDGA